MNKQEALEKVKQMKKELKDLEKIINTPEKDWKSVKSFEDACKFLGDLSPNHLISSWKKADLTEQQIAGLKLEYCIKAINEGWKPDWKDSNEIKYYNCFEFRNGRWFFHWVFDRSLYSCCGFGFYYETKEKAQFGAKYFKQYYDTWLG